jgi:hypothetical protein
MTSFYNTIPTSLAHPAALQVESVVSDTRRWLEKAVIGLNLCPFAKAVHTKGQIHYAVTAAASADALLAALDQELAALVALDEEVRSTTLLIAPDVFPNFLDFNDFLEAADALLVARELDGTLQIASFHPQFQFAGTAPDDISNATNRAPYPTLHLLREASIDVAVAAFPEADAIYLRNIATLEALGQAGWEGLKVGASKPTSPTEKGVR